MIYLQLALAGVTSGSIAALSGLGLILTYRATGVFNFAHGAVAMTVAYVLWQMVVGWGWPLWISALLAVLVVAPLIGIVLERVVFRPLETNGATTYEKLVATLGVFVVLVGFAVTVWGALPKSDAPSLFATTPIRLTQDLQLGRNQLAQVVIVLLSAALLYVLFRRSHTGVRIRAVVDRRQLADLAAVNANSVARLAWALGCTFAGLSGVLLAPQLTLDPFRLTLLVIDTFAVAVIARLTSLPLGLLSGIGLGVAQSLLTRWTPPDPWASLKPNLLVVALLVFLLLYKSLNERQDDGVQARTATSLPSVAGRSRRRRAVGVVFLALVLAVVPLVLSGERLLDAQRVLGLAVVFLSIVAVTGFTGNITLGQAGFVGIGALLSSRLTTGQVPLLPQLPVVPAMFVASVLVALLGIATGYSALRRRGLFLGLTTLAVGLVLNRFVFENPYFLNQVIVQRPALFGISLDGERAFYSFCAVCLLLAVVLVDQLRQGPLGRALSAMRDSETGARSVGMDLRAYKLLAFGLSAFLAAFGGALLSQQQRAFSGPSFNPFTSLFWFTAVVVAGVTFLSGAVVASVLFVVLDSLLGQGASSLLIGLLALFSGQLRGGLVAQALRLASALSPGRAFVAATARPPGSGPLVAALEPRPSAFAQRVLQEVGR